MNSTELATLASDVAGRIWNEDSCAVKGIWEGQTVNIFGAGPSAHPSYHGGVIDCQCGPVIACNSAIQIMPFANLWLTSEISVHLLPWFHEAQPQGMVCMEAGITEDNPTRPAVDPTCRPDDFWRRVLWHRRKCLAYDDQTAYPSLWKHDFREPSGSLYVVLDQDCGVQEGLGTVAGRALQIAMLAGASKVVFWGCELMFTDGKQYATGHEAYLGPDPRDQWTNAPINFRIEDGEPVEDESGPYRSTRLMLNSSIALRAMLERCEEQGLEWRDESRGLLNPSVLI